MHGSAAILLTVLPAAMIQATKHYESLADVQASVHDTLGTIRAKIRLFVSPKVASRDNSRCAIFTVGVAPRDKETKEHVTVWVVGINGSVAGMVVLVVAVQPLSGGSRLDIHRDSDGEKRLRYVDGRLISIPATRFQGEKVFHQVLFEKHSWLLRNMKMQVLAEPRPTKVTSKKSI